jgi:hypothetical protein
MIVEILVSLLQPYTFLKGRYYISDPYYWLVTYKYEVNDLLLVPIFLRAYVIFRFCISMSSFYDHRSARITYININSGNYSAAQLTDFLLSNA